MIKFENEGFLWSDALRNMSAKGYRMTKNGKYESFCSNHGISVFLGTYDTIEEAKESVFNYRANRLINSVENYGLKIGDGVVFENNYIVFSNGIIFNLHGDIISGGIDRCGYISGILNGRNILFHRIIASIFCDREPGKDFVNHIDGDKTNNDCRNLEWVTRSENAIHSFRIGLQNNVAGNPIFSEEEKEYMREHRFENYRVVASCLERNPETIRKYLYKYRKENNND